MHARGRELTEMEVCSGFHSEVRSRIHGAMEQGLRKSGFYGGRWLWLWSTTETERCGVEEEDGAAREKTHAEKMKEKQRY
ncbi:hypothetical protein RJT34_13113 [Clitoria ternatea]|uniref:Uncharacterized protein n=1 Tax=Clitoria ternatea TaxID=43366 RepID=A0AAN9JRI2_CLITE